MKNDRKKTPVFTISIVAKFLDIHPQTLRLYERLGLICPSRSDGHTRLYSEEDIEKVKKIKHFTQDMGVNLAGVEIILKMLERVQEIEDEFEKERKLLEDEFEKKLNMLGLKMLKDSF